MTKLTKAALALAVSLNTAFVFGGENDIQTGGRIYGSPSEQYRVQGVPNFQRYEPYDLPFALPHSLQWQHNYYSEDFYAIMLKSQKAVPDDGPSGRKNCSGYFSEAERLKVQQQFPQNKAFASRVGCSAHMVGYTNFNSTYNFLAVYAGRSMAEAKDLLKKAQSSGYRDANIRKMQVILYYGD